MTRCQEKKADFEDQFGNWDSCLFKQFAQEPNTDKQHGMVILVSDVIVFFVNKEAVVQTDKESDWQEN